MSYNRARAVKAAIASSRPGDVVLLEMQEADRFGNPTGPAELSLSIWQLVKAGTDAGVVVVGAAGNGNVNLSSSAYDSYRGRGDSGAIIVGAGNHNHAKTSFSTYGERVDVQAWGDSSVMTAGYGDCSGFPSSIDPNKQYTIDFAGTSSASAIVAGAVTLFQSWALRHLGSPMAPKELRELLKSTGRPQLGGSTQHVGPHINLRAAAQAANGGVMPTPSANDTLSTNDTSSTTVTMSTNVTLSTTLTTSTTR